MEVGDAEASKRMAHRRKATADFRDEPTAAGGHGRVGGGGGGKKQSCEVCTLQEPSAPGHTLKRYGSVLPGR
jgi:hypothetical protein